MALPHTSLTHKGLDHIVQLLEDCDYRASLITKLNENVDVPFITEQTEEKILQAIYSCVLDAMHALQALKDD